MFYPRQSSWLNCSHLIVMTFNAILAKCVRRSILSICLQLVDSWPATVVSSRRLIARGEVAGIWVPQTHSDARWKERNSVNNIVGMDITMIFFPRFAAILLVRIHGHTYTHDFDETHARKSGTMRRRYRW